MFYHESVPILIEALLDSAEVVDAETAIVRDASGRLSVARKSFTNAAALKVRIQKALGLYASSLPVIDGSFAQALLNGPGGSTSYAIVREESYAFTYVDNRIVGGDWLNKYVSKGADGSERRITFYSLKGGVGRSTALAVYAAYLATKGQKVLTIDLDIEAPGLGSILLPDGATDDQSYLPRFGVIDYLLENGLSGVGDQTLSDFIGTSPFGKGSIDVLPAIGRETEVRPHLYMEKLSRALTEDYVDGKKVSLSAQVQQMVERFERTRAYDAVLIDARAGFSEITAATLMGLDSHLVFFGIDQSQTYSGYRYLLSHLISQTDFSRDGGANWRERLTFVQSKAPATKRERAPFKAELFDVCAGTIYDELSEGEDEYNLFTFAPQDESPFAPHNAAYVRFDTAYSNFDPSKHDEQLDPELFSVAYSSFISRLDAVMDQKGEF